MIAKTQSYALLGLEGVPVTVETDISKGLPSFDMVGLPDAAVKESKERVKSAIKNSGLDFPNRAITVNFAPAYVKKEGSSFDLPTAVCLLSAYGIIPPTATQNVTFLGELALSGELRGITGVLPALISARDKGFTTFIVPKANEKEAGYIDGITVYTASSLKEVVEHLTGVCPLKKAEAMQFEAGKKDLSSHDLAFVRGQPIAKRALEVAIAGGHNILFVGPPGSGKTMLARAIPAVLPDMTFDEALEITKIHSVAGTLGDQGIVSVRPFRSPHHTATTVSLCGGGNKTVHPGEISLAHGGVLFLDELPEYKRSTLEALRQPLEDGVITISRSGGTVTYPASFMLCASMNPCPCGNYGSRNKKCTCTPNDIRKYRAKISGPLLDRIDIQVEVDNVKYDDLVSTRQEESSAEVKKRTDDARKIQRVRFEGKKISSNSEMGEKELRTYCALSPECEEILRTSFEMLRLSARARARILKVARTIADLSFCENVQPQHILEAISYRAYGGVEDEL